MTSIHVNKQLSDTAKFIDNLDLRDCFGASPDHAHLLRITSSTETDDVRGESDVRISFGFDAEYAQQTFYVKVNSTATNGNTSHERRMESVVAARGLHTLKETHTQTATKDNTTTSRSYTITNCAPFTWSAVYCVRGVDGVACFTKRRTITVSEESCHRFIGEGALMVLLRCMALAHASREYKFRWISFNPEMGEYMMNTSLIRPTASGVELYCVRRETRLHKKQPSPRCTQTNNCGSTWVDTTFTKNGGSPLITVGQHVGIEEVNELYVNATCAHCTAFDGDHNKEEDYSSIADVDFHPESSDGAEMQGKVSFASGYASANIPNSDRSHLTGSSMGLRRLFGEDESVIDAAELDRSYAESDLLTKSNATGRLGMALTTDLARLDEEWMESPVEEKEESHSSQRSSVTLFLSKDMAIETPQPTDQQPTRENYEELYRTHMVDCDAYLANHAHLADMLADYVDCLLGARPDDVLRFSATYFQLRGLSKQNNFKLAKQ